VAGRWLRFSILTPAHGRVLVPPKRIKLQPSELLTILRELALQYKAYETTNPRIRGAVL
jgi:hypothetical protein